MFISTLTFELVVMAIMFVSAGEKVRPRSLALDAVVSKAVGSFFWPALSRVK